MIRKIFNHLLQFYNLDYKNKLSNWMKEICISSNKKSIWKQLKEKENINNLKNSGNKKMMKISYILLNNRLEVLQNMARKIVKIMLRMMEEMVESILITIKIIIIKLIWEEKMLSLKKSLETIIIKQDKVKRGPTRSLKSLLIFQFTRESNFLLI